MRIEKRRRTLVFVALTSVVFGNGWGERMGRSAVALPAQAQGGQAPTTLPALSEEQSQAARDAILARLSLVETVSCAFDSQMKSSLPPWILKAMEKDDEALSKNQPGVRHSQAVGECRITGSLSSLGAYRKIQIAYPPETVALARQMKWVPLVPQEWVVTPERTEWLVRGDGDPVGVIRTANRDIPTELNVDLGLGLREYATGKILTAEDWKLKPLSMDAHGNFVIQEIKPQNVLQEWVFSHEQGFALIRYNMYVGTDLRVTIQCDDFRNIGGILMPHSITQLRFLRSGIGADPVLSIKTRVSDYAVGGKENKAAAYQMVWPRGSSFIDTRTNHQVDVNEPRSYTDDEILKLAAEKEKAKKGIEKRAQDLIDSLRKQQPGSPP